MNGHGEAGGRDKTGSKICTVPSGLDGNCEGEKISDFWE